MKFSMRTLKMSFSKAALIGSLIGTILFGGASMAFATLKVVQTPTYHLYSGESGTATSVRIAPYPIDLDGVKLTMSDFGDTPTMTVDPKVTGTEEIESFTGIVDNGDNTATLTGLSRDLQSKYPYTGSGTGRSHGSGATIVFGNNPQVYGRLAAWENAGSISALWTFLTSPIVPTPTISTQAANKAYVDSVAIAGAPNATTIVQGLVQIATPIQVASSTATGSTGAFLVAPLSMATSSNDVAGLHLVVTQNSGKINWNQIDLGTSFTSTAVDTFSGGILDNAASSTFSGTVNLNGAVLANGISLARSFGGTGANGALSISTGTTTISLGNASYFELNYSSISITGTGNLTFSNPNTNGTFIVIRSQGNVALTCSNADCISVRGLGASGGLGAQTCSVSTAGSAGSNGNAFYLFKTNAGTGGLSSGVGTGGSIPTAIVPVSFSTSTLMKYGGQFWVGSGGGGGTCAESGGSGGVGGNGGAGGGGILLEVGGSLNLTATNAIDASGLTGSQGTGSSGNFCGGGGGGGGGGFIKVIFNTLTANSGSLLAINGIGGLNASSCAVTTYGGGGGASAYTSGANGTSASSINTQTGGNGGIGATSTEQNSSFY